MLKEIHRAVSTQGSMDLVTWQDYSNGDCDPAMNTGTENSELEQQTGYGENRVRVIDPPEEETFRRLRNQLEDYRRLQDNS